MNVCADVGLTSFDYQCRMVYVDRYTVRIVGKVIPHGGLLQSGNRRTGYPVVSQLDLRKEKRKKGGSHTNKWTAEFFAQDLSAAQVKEKAAELSTAVKSAQEDIKDPRKGMKSLEQTETLLRQAANRVKPPERFRTDAYKRLQAKRVEVRSALVELNQKEEELRMLRKQLYYYNKLDKADKTPKDASGSQVNRTTPNWDHYTVEDDVQHLDISELITNSDKGTVVFSGTDYGICKMSETVALSMKQVAEHLSYYYAMSGKSFRRSEGTCTRYLEKFAFSQMFYDRCIA